MLFKLFGVTRFQGLVSPPFRGAGKGIALSIIRLAFIISYLFLYQGVFSQDIPDTIQTYQLQQVEVITSARPSTARTTSPLQVMQKSELEKTNALQVSDAIKFFSGVQVKDYGGVGGPKTISLRSLGANYTSVSYDGIPLFDNQTGQIDVGRFSVDNVKMISLNIGESDNIFQTARTQAAAGALSIFTQLISGESTKKTEVKAGIKAGSFSLINPSLIVNHALSPVFSLNTSVEWLKTDGDYPYTQYYDYNSDSSSVEKRRNSDVETWKLETNLSGLFSNGGKLLWKTYYYDSNRGLPGPAIMHASDLYTGERTHDQNFFTQANYIQPISEKIDFQANAKFNFSGIYYSDVAAKYPNGKIENEYFQREYYANATFLYKSSEKLSFSWANDGSYTNLSNDLRNCVFPFRTSWLSAISGKYESGMVTLTASLLNQYMHDASQKSDDESDQNHLSPYMGFSVKPFNNLPLRVRGFYKNTFRMPTFGDIYFSSMPKTNLKPENANQYNLGLTWVSTLNGLFPYFSISADAYLNRIENKIVAFPTGGSMFIWSVINYGKVEIKGMDLDLGMHIQTGSHFLWLINGNYTYQNVVDKTDASLENYNQQLPYTPHHTVSGYIGLETPWVNFNYTLLYCGKRYYNRINRPEFQMNAYADQGISLSRTFNWKENIFSFSAECLNLFDEHYDVVRLYPMPGRSFRLGIKFTY